MKTKLLLFALAAITLVSIGASRISSQDKSIAQTKINSAPIGGLAVDNK